MKFLFILLLVLSLGACASAPIIYDLNEKMTREEIGQLYKHPDKVIHSKKDGHIYDEWMYKDEGIKLVFEDGILIEWHN